MKKMRVVWSPDVEVRILSGPTPMSGGGDAENSRTKTTAVISAMTAMTTSKAQEGSPMDSAAVSVANNRG